MSRWFSGIPFLEGGEEVNQKTFRAFSCQIRHLTKEMRQLVGATEDKRKCSHLRWIEPSQPCELSS
jgi:hypothetical protein